ncbi:hypothetical protein ACFOOM_12755 [Streptomyces echinoruber]|uniref:hypothetical protein n=1 Tax=Streptomyces echinoruber TaxID=68898 RepID=UPI001E64C364|nr:hypothetical protein [Streptomyces echinoruber]
MAEQKSSTARPQEPRSVPQPLRGTASVLRRVPGAGLVGRAAEGTLDKVGAVSPRGRRIAVYAGAGLLGAAGVVEWPVALTGAAVAWLTQPRPAKEGAEAAGKAPEEAPAAPAAGALGDGGAAPGADETSRNENEPSGEASEGGAGSSAKASKSSKATKATKG